LPLISARVLPTGAIGDDRRWRLAKFPRRESGGVDRPTPVTSVVAVSVHRRHTALVKLFRQTIYAEWYRAGRR
jgi:hypothetical protein